MGLKKQRFNECQFKRLIRCCFDDRGLFPELPRSPHFIYIKLFGLIPPDSLDDCQRLIPFFSYLRSTFFQLHSQSWDFFPCDEIFSFYLFIKGEKQVAAKMCNLQLLYFSLSEGQTHSWISCSASHVFPWSPVPPQLTCGFNPGFSHLKIERQLSFNYFQLSSFKTNY